MALHGQGVLVRLGMTEAMFLVHALKALQLHGGDNSLDEQACSSIHLAKSDKKRDHMPFLSLHV